MCDERFPTVALIYPLKAQIVESMSAKATDSSQKGCKRRPTETLHPVKEYLALLVT